MVKSKVRNDLFEQNEVSAPADVPTLREKV